MTDLGLCSSARRKGVSGDAETPRGGLIQGITATHRHMKRSVPKNSGQWKSGRGRLMAFHDRK